MSDPVVPNLRRWQWIPWLGKEQACRGGCPTAVPRPWCFGFGSGRGCWFRLPELDPHDGVEGHTTAGFHFQQDLLHLKASLIRIDVEHTHCACRTGSECILKGTPKKRETATQEKNMRYRVRSIRLPELDLTSNSNSLIADA